MIEFDVDMGYLLEAGELDSVVLNDENGEHEPMTFRQGGGECENVSDEPQCFQCSECKKRGNVRKAFDNGTRFSFCPDCGAKVKAVKRWND